MKNIAAVAIVMVIGSVPAGMKASAQRPPTASGPPVRNGGFTGPSLSVRPPDQRLARTSAVNLLGWRAGIRTDAFGPLTFFEAAGKADAAGMAFVEGVSTQQVSPEISEKLDYNLDAAGVDKVKARLNELRLRMPAYYVETVPADQASRRKLFEFAKSLGVDTIVCSPPPDSLADLDKLANESGIDVAVVNRNPKGVVTAFEGLSKHVGVGADLGAWRKAGVKPLDGLAQLKDRLLAADLSEQSTADLMPFLLELSRLSPLNRPVDYPLPPGRDGAGHKAQVKPLFFRLGPAANLSDVAARYDTAVGPAICYRVDELARLTPISTPEKVPADQRQRIDSAIPRQALVTPRKPRKLLVLDLAINGSFYHGSAPLGNLSLELMAKYTGAFTPVFSNDLDNLKYPKIKQYDGVFLNQIQGEVFADRDAIDGLTRYLREGGGVAGLHAATWASQNVPQYGEMMGATSGAHKYNGEPGALRIDDPNSPITKQFEGKPFEFLDEFYHYIPAGPYSREKLHVLLSLDPARKDLSGNQYPNRPDGDYGMVWIRSYGKGRVFNVGLGHRPEFYETSNMQQMVLAGVQFILGDLEADTTPSGSVPSK